MMQSWRTRVLCDGAGLRPRQFEYHPTLPDLLLFGTIRGQVLVVNTETGAPVRAFYGGLARDHHDSILGLSWLRSNPNRFLMGSSFGVLTMVDISQAPEKEEGEHDLSSEEGTLSLPGFPLRWQRPGVVTTFQPFDKLTSVHGNCLDQYMLVSGYSHGVRIYDLATGECTAEQEEIHGDHINISRFANHSPYIFATCSFDRSMKAWDLRRPFKNGPLYTTESTRGHVMVCFSPDDVYVLTSAVDNEITQYLSVDGRECLKLSTERTGLEDNFTRAYYNCSGRVILSGSSEEKVVRLHCAQTGELIEASEMYPRRKHNSLYIQSLRGDPLNEHRFSILANYRDAAYPLEIVTVDMHRGGVEEGGEEEDLSSLNEVLPTRELGKDLGRLYTRGVAGADMVLVVVTSVRQMRFPVLAGLVSARCPVLKEVILRELGNGGQGGPHHPHQSAASLGRSSSGTSSSSMPEVQVNLSHVPGLDEAGLEVVMKYLYMDDLILEGLLPPDPSGHLPGIPTAELLTQLKKLEVVLEVSKALGLERLFSLAAWHCRQLVNSETVVGVAQLARRTGAKDLYDFALQFAAAHWEVVHAYDQEERGKDGGGSGIKRTTALSRDTELRQAIRRVRKEGFKPVVASFSMPYSDGSYDEHSDTSQDEGEDDDGNESDDWDVVNDDEGDQDMDQGGDEEMYDFGGVYGALPNNQEAGGAAAAVGAGGGAAAGGAQAAGGGATLPPPPPVEPNAGAVVGALIPKHTGHTCTSMLGHLLVVLGGGNRRQFHSFRSLLMLDTRSMTWTKPQARGEAPNSLIYHSCTPLESRNARHLLLYGGSFNSSHRLVESRQAFVLDLLTLRWECPQVHGPVPEHRTRHTLVALYPEYFSSGGTNTTPGSGHGSSPSRVTPNTTYLVLFGGYAPTERQAFNDLMVLRVDKMVGRDGYSYVWMAPTVIGAPPHQRLAHTSAVVPLSAAEGGPRMLVFGGVGLGAIYGDLHSLRCQDPSCMVWEEAQVVEGSPPTARYGHSMCECGPRSVAVFGGTSQQSLNHLAFNDLHILTITSATPESLRVQWSLVEPPQGSPLPCPRSRQTMVSQDDGKSLYIFGGSDEGCSGGAGGAQTKIREVDTDVYVVTLDARRENEEVSTLPTRWTWHKPAMRILTFDYEAPVRVRPSRLRVDLQSLLECPILPDITLQGSQSDIMTSLFPSAAQYQGAANLLFRAHRALLTLRCPHFHAMLASGMKEAKATVVTLQDIDAQLLQMILQYIYTDTIQVYDAEQLLPLIIAAHRLALDRLVLLCEGLVRCGLDQDNCLDLLQFGDTYDLPGTKAAAMTVALRYASDGRVDLNELAPHLRGLLEDMMGKTGKAWGSQPPKEKLV